MLITPDGVLYTWLRYRFSRQKSSMSSKKATFLVKRTDRRFNHVSADQSTEWLNAIGKKSGGLVCITRVASALTRWTVSYNLRTVIASQTTAMLRLTTDDEDHKMMSTQTMSAQKVGWRNTILVKETLLYR